MTTAAPSSTPSHIFAGPAAKAATAPFLADDVAEALDFVELALFEAPEAPEAVLEADDEPPVVEPVVVAPTVVGPVDDAPVVDVAAKGAVDWPSISDWTSALKLPVIPVNANLAEKARAGN